MDRGRVAEILSNALDGMGSAREELFTLYRPYLKFVSEGLVGGAITKRNDSSDVVQQTCADAAVRLQEFRGKSEPEFTAWITSILRNKVAEAYRFKHAGKTRHAPRGQPVAQRLNGFRELALSFEERGDSY